MPLRESQFISPSNLSWTWGLLPLFPNGCLGSWPYLPLISLLLPLSSTLHCCHVLFCQGNGLLLLICLTTSPSLASSPLLLLFHTFQRGIWLTYRLQKGRWGAIPRDGKILERDPKLPLCILLNCLRIMKLHFWGFHLGCGFLKWCILAAIMFVTCVFLKL